MSELKESLLKIIKANSDTPDAEFLATSLDEHLSDSIAKFIRGYAEHRGSIMDRPLMQDLKQEIIDSNHYLYALMAKRDVIIQKLQIIHLANPHLQEIKEILTLLINL